MYYFLKEDYDALNAEIDKIIDLMKKIGSEMGKSCQEGAETFHDNFAYEDGARQQFMWSKRLREFMIIRNNARVISPEMVKIVSLGRTVTFEDEDSGEKRTLRIGSYMVFVQKDENVISYNTPIARILIGAKIGDRRQGIIAGKQKNYLILEIT